MAQLRQQRWPPAVPWRRDSWPMLLRRREQQVLIVIAEIRDRRDRLHRDTVDVSVRIEAERHIRRLDGLVFETGDERVVLVVLERAAHARRRLEVDRQLAVPGKDLDVAVP